MLRLITLLTSGLTNSLLSLLHVIGAAFNHDPEPTGHIGVAFDHLSGGLSPLRIPFGGQGNQPTAPANGKPDDGGVVRRVDTVVLACGPYRGNYHGNHLRLRRRKKRLTRQTASPPTVVPIGAAT